MFQLVIKKMNMSHPYLNPLTELHNDQLEKPELTLKNRNYRKLKQIKSKIIQLLIYLVVLLQISLQQKRNHLRNSLRWLLHQGDHMIMN